MGLSFLIGHDGRGKTQFGDATIKAVDGAIQRDRA
jgi:hypothetical protein